MCALLIGALWFLSMPYPFPVWLDARREARFRIRWGIPDADFVAARRLVEKKMGFREIIGNVVVDAAEIRFRTVQRWEGPVAGSGRFFVAKEVDGTWAIVEDHLWMS